MGHTGIQLRSTVQKGGQLELSLEPALAPDPGPDEVVVRIEAAPINPSDLGLLFGPADMRTAKASGTQARPVVTADIPLAARCLELDAYALGTNGREFTHDSIGGALAVREIKASIRETGVITGGPAPITAKDRSRFSNALDTIVQRALRAG